MPIPSVYIILLLETSSSLNYTLTPLTLIENPVERFWPILAAFNAGLSIWLKSPKKWINYERVRKLQSAFSNVNHIEAFFNCDCVHPRGMYFLPKNYIPINLLWIYPLKILSNIPNDPFSPLSSKTSIFMNWWSIFL